MKQSMELLLTSLVCSQDGDGDKASIETTFKKLLSDTPKEELIEAMIYLSQRFVTAFQAAREQYELYAICEFGMHPHDAEKMNLPTMSGALFGMQLPQIDEDKVCKGCAFRKGSPANQCPSTVIDAERCLMEGETFFCHEEMNGSEPTRKCRGYLQASKDLHENALKIVAASMGSK